MCTWIAPTGVDFSRILYYLQSRINEQLSEPRHPPPGNSIKLVLRSHNLVNWIDWQLQADCIGMCKNVDEESRAIAHVRMIAQHVEQETQGYYLDELQRVYTFVRKCLVIYIAHVRENEHNQFYDEFPDTVSEFRWRKYEYGSSEERANARGLEKDLQDGTL